MQQQIQADMEKEQSNLRSDQAETLQRLRQNLDQQFADEQSRLRCIYCTSV